MVIQLSKFIRSLDCALKMAFKMEFMVYKLYLKAALKIEVR